MWSGRGRITHGCLGLYTDANEAALARVVAHCRHIGTAKLGIQLAHAGRKASSQRPWEGGTASSATAATSRGRRSDRRRSRSAPAWPAPREMDEHDIAQVRDAFVMAAKRARAHRLRCDRAAHGARLPGCTASLSPISNRRTDRYRRRAAGRRALSARRPPRRCARSSPGACRSAPASPAATGPRAA